MKTKFTFIVLFILTKTIVYSQQIDFFNVGWQDKPLMNLIISKDKKSGGIFVKNVIVTEEAYNIIKQYVFDNNTHKRPSKNKYSKEKDTCYGCYDFGCYAVEITGEKKKLTYFMVTNEKTVNFFNGLINILKGKGYTNISKEFEKIVIRINFIETSCSPNALRSVKKI